MVILRRFRHLLNRRRSEAEMAEEMRQHLEQRAAELAADGLPPDEARNAAQRRFGNLASIQEQAREAHGWGWLERFGKDLRFAVRQLVRSPGFTLLAVVTLGLGIGANTSMFSVLNGVMLKPLPYAHLDRLERVYRATPQNPESNIPPADYLDLLQAQAGYGEFSGYQVVNASLADPGQPAELAFSARTAVNFFALLGVQPQLGRNFRDDEDAPGRNRVVILSQRVWKNRYGARPDIVGHTVRIDGEPHEVVGVLPLSFNDWRYLGSVDFFRPLTFTTEMAANRKDPLMRVIGRRTEGLTDAQAKAFFAGVTAQFAQAHPAENAGVTWWAESLQKLASGPGSTTILPMLIALSGFVLLLACSNLANLYLVRTITRAREFAVRAALGASRLQLLRPLVAESLVLSLAGGGLALFVADWFHRWAQVQSTGDNGEQVHFTLDPSVLAWTFGASVFTALAFGLAPALYASRLDLNHTLKSGGRGSTGGRGARRFRQILTIGQFAVAMVLLSGAVIFIGGLENLYNRRGGWDASRLVTGTVALPVAVYGDNTKVADFQRRALEHLRAIPAVDAASLAANVPFHYWPEVGKFLVEGRDRPPDGREPAAMINTVGADYFGTVGTRVISGRAFTERDNSDATKVYILGQSTARTLFGDANPAGRRIAPATDGAPAWGEVVGVVTDVQAVDPKDNPVTMQVYQTLAQAPRRQFEIIVRAAGVAPSALVPEIRAVMAELDADLPVRLLRPAEESIHRYLYQMGVLRDMFSAFGLLGLALASLGIYGVIARTMAQRTGEFAIRLALGARVGDIVRLVFGAGLRQALIGAALGVAGAYGVAYVISLGFPNIRTNNAVALATSTAVLIAVAILACWLPARRAGRINAVNALRAE